METKNIDNKNEINNQNINDNIHNNEKEYKIQFMINNEIKKLKINLEIINKDDNTKDCYSNSITLNELISLNNYFSKFKEYPDAFNYLIDNYSKLNNKIEQISYKKIRIILLFTIEENNNIYEEPIELILNKKNKILNSNISSVISNLKITLENFDTSIKELNLFIEKDKNEKDKKLDELENNIKKKLDKLGNEKNSQGNKKEEELLVFNNKLNEIFSKIGEYNKEISKLKDKGNENERKDNYITDKKINELISKINNLEEKIKPGEKDNEIDNPPNIENIISKKINNIFDDKIKLLDEKIQILNNKVINLERGQNKLYEKNRNEESFIKDVSFNFGDSILYDKYDKKFQNMNNNINIKLKKLANKLNINLKDIDLDTSDINNIEDKTNDTPINDIKDFNAKIMNEISNKIKLMNTELENKVKNTIEKKINEIIDIKIQEIRQEIYSMINKISERGKEDYKDLNNKINILRNEIIKIVDSKINIIDNKVKIIDIKGNKITKENQTYLEKISFFEIKFKNIDNKIKQIDIKMQNIDSNNQLNNSYIISCTRNLLNGNNSLNLNEEININHQKNASNTFLNNSKTQNQEKSSEIDSKIIKNEERKNNFLFSKIKDINPFNKTIKYNLIYRATRDGDSAKNFHLKCDFIGPNITLIKTKKGYIFGGFTYKGWKHLFKDIKKDVPEFGTEIKDEKAFGFSINEKKIYKNGKPDEFAISCNNNYGPIFKNNFFKVCNEFMKNGGICGKIEESNFVGQEKEFEINGGEEKFDIEEMEIFQILFK